MDKLIIVVAPVGAEVTRKEQPNLPITAGEIAREVKRCREAGAAVVHLHVRDKDGNPTQDKNVFRKAIEAIKQEAPDIIVQVSTGGAVWMTPEERMQSIYSHDAVEMATISTGTLNFGEDVFMNTFKIMESFAKAIKERGIKPEIECFDAGHLDNAMILVKRGLITLPGHFDFVLGVPGAMAGALRNMVFMSNSVPAGSTWQVAGIGRAELPLAVASVVSGGHVRVGFEDNIFYSKGRLANSNAELVARVSRVAAEVGREVATPDEARRILGITSS
ncbi:MAG: 3-keto-5-aminohexanoate cleavage protein [Firmicutes bacterium]|nr:3-keto-5-aminohexanoate cleavage protein [Bacillota bacterium]